MQLQQTHEIPDLLGEIDNLLNEVGARIDNRVIPDVRHKSYAEIDADLDAANDAMIAGVMDVAQNLDPTAVRITSALGKLAEGSDIEPLLALSCDDLLTTKRPEAERKQAVLGALLTEAGLWNPGRIAPPVPTNYNSIRTRFNFLGAGRFKDSGLFFVHFDMVNVDEAAAIFDEGLNTKVQPQAHLYIGVNARAEGDNLVDAPPLELKPSHVGRLHTIKTDAKRLNLL